MQQIPFEAVVVSYFDEAGIQVLEKVDICALKDQCALTIATSIDKILRKLKLSPERVYLLVGCDNAVTNMGETGGVIELLKSIRQETQIFRWRVLAVAGCDAYSCNLILNWFDKVRCCCFRDEFLARW